MITPHLIQLFSLVAMEPPVAFDADAVRDEKLKVLRAVRPIPRRPRRATGRCARSTCRARVDGEEVPGLPRRGARRAGLAHRDLRGAQAARRQLALAGRAVLPAHRQAPGAARHRDRHPLQAAAGAALPRRRRPAAACSPTCSCCACSRTRASRCSIESKMPGPRASPCSRWPWTTPTAPRCTSCPSAPTRRCSWTRWRAT